MWFLGVTMRRFLLALFFAICYSQSAVAWKIDVHIWIAQQVLNEARQGYVTVSVDGEPVRVAIKDRYRRALVKHPKSFLLGSIGPDAFPGAVSGQLVIHPSIPDGWGAADWLRLLLEDDTLNDEELAFTLGFSSHLSADVFAHTYVNRYAGDVFNFSEHEWAAIRHIHIESYVSNHLPPLIDSETGHAVAAADAVRTDGEILIPESLLVRKFFLNDLAIDQMSRSGGAPHLVGAKKLYDTLDDFVGDDGLLLEIEGLTIQYIAKLKLDIDISIEQAKELQKLSNKFNDELNNIAGDASDFLQDINNEYSKIEGFQIDVAEKAFGAAIDVSNELLKVNEEILKFGNELSDLENKLLGIPKKLTKTITDTICGKLGPFKSFCKDIFKLVEYANPAYTSAKARKELLERSLAVLQSERPKLQQRLKSAIREGFETVRTLHEAKRVLTNQLISYLETRPFGPFHRRYFEQWRDGIPIALAEYSRANAEAITNSIDPDKPSVTGPLKEWLICYGPVFASVPAYIGDTACEGLDAYRKIKSQLDELETKVAEVIPILSEVLALKNKLEGKISELKDRVFREILVAGLGEFDKIANSNSVHIYKGLTQHVGPGELNIVMSKDNSNQNLPLVADAAARISTEMHLSNGVFSPQEFAPIANSIILSKLSLLTANGLNYVSRQAGYEVVGENEKLYDDSSDGRHVLYGFAKNIDGNHQWHMLAPPHPRNDGVGYDQQDFIERGTNPDKRYGYDDSTCSTSPGGMRLWTNALARESVFKKIFKGFVVPGIDYPSSLNVGFQDTLPSNYPKTILGDDGWLTDGIELFSDKHGTSRKLAINIKNAPKNGHIEVRINQRDQRIYPIPETGEFIGTVDLYNWQIPAIIDLRITNVEGTTIQRTRHNAGCDGSSIQSTLSQPPAVVIVKGDNLWNISKRATGEGIRYKELFEANKNSIKNPDLIFPDQEFQLPWSTNVNISAEGS